MVDGMAFALLWLGIFFHQHWQRSIFKRIPHTDSSACDPDPTLFPLFSQIHPSEYAFLDECLPVWVVYVRSVSPAQTPRFQPEQARARLVPGHASHALLVDAESPAPQPSGAQNAGGMKRISRLRAVFVFEGTGEQEIQKTGTPMVDSDCPSTAVPDFILQRHSLSGGLAAPSWRTRSRSHGDQNIYFVFSRSHDCVFSCICTCSHAQVER